MLGLKGRGKCGEGGGVGVRDVPLKKERGRQNTLEPRGLLPHLFFPARHHTGMFNLRNQSRDVTGCDSPFLTHSAVDLTLSRSDTVMDRMLRKSRAMC